VLDDILDEVVELFLSEYIHIGGDETPKKTRKNLQPLTSTLINKQSNDHELDINQSIPITK
jgi:hexosaminidase